MPPTARSAAARPAVTRFRNDAPIPFDLAVEAAFVARDGRVLEVLRDDVATTVLTLGPIEVDTRVTEYRLALRDLGSSPLQAWIARRLAELEAARDQARTAMAS